MIPAVRAGGPAAQRVRKTTRGLLVASEFTLALVLLIGFGLLLRSFLRVEAIPAGFRTDRLLTISANLSGPRYRDEAQRVAFARTLLGRVRGLPAVRSAAMTSNLPLTGAGDTRIRVEGRALSAHDDAGSGAVVVINETMARALFPWGDAVGHRIRMEEQPPLWREIVGIAATCANAISKKTRAGVLPPVRARARPSRQFGGVCPIGRRDAARGGGAAQKRSRGRSAAAMGPGRNQSSVYWAHSPRLR